MSLLKAVEKSTKNNFLISLLPYLFIVIAAFPAVAAITQPGYFSMHDDLQVMRQLQMSKCWEDFQIPCRWVPDLGYGFGYPLFNYYPPMPYYLGQVVHFLGFSFLDTVKVLFVLAFILSGFTMYLLASEFFGKIGGVVAAVFYIFAPYHAIDVYVRGAANEAWALVWFPAILWSIYKLVKTGQLIFILFSAVFTAFLTISHLPMMMVFVPGALVWTIFWLIAEKSFKNLPKLVISGIFGLGLAAFFIIPVIFEQKFAHTETLFIGYFNYLAHFTNINQLFFSRYWGYGESVFGPADTMAFPLGHLHWIGTIIALFVAWQLRKKFPKISATILLFFAWIYFYTFLTHQRSALIWRIATPLQFLQFPWRILALSMVGTSFLAGAAILLFQKFNRIFRLSIAGILIILVIVFNFQFFTWREFFPQMTDAEKFSGKNWQLQQTSGIFDYLPKQLPLPPKDPPDGDAKFLTGVGEFAKLAKNSVIQEYKIKVNSETAEFQINTFYFPGWKVFVNSKEVPIDPSRDKVNGTMIVDLQKGVYTIRAEFEKTPIRAASDIISGVSWLILLGLFLAFSFKKFK